MSENDNSPAVGPSILVPGGKAVEGPMDPSGNAATGQRYPTPAELASMGAQAQGVPQPNVDDLVGDVDQLGAKAKTAVKNAEIDFESFLRELDARASGDRWWLFLAGLVSGIGATAYLCLTHVI